MKRYDKEFWEMLDVLVHASEIAGQRERSIPGIRSLFIRWITDI